MDLQILLQVRWSARSYVTGSAHMLVVRWQKQLPTPCLPTGVGAVLNPTKVQPGSTVAVFGAGGVGLSVITGAHLAGAARIIAIDVAEAKDDIARSFGATDFIPASPVANDEIRTLIEKRGADYVFEVVGNAELQVDCPDAVQPGGTFIFVSVTPSGAATNQPGTIITFDEKTVTGSIFSTTHTHRDFNQYGNLFLQGKFPIDRLISNTYPLTQINEACARC